MKTQISLALLALIAASASASAQIRTGDRVRDRVILDDRRSEPRDTRTGTTIGDIVFGRAGRTMEQREASRRGIPRGHLPRAGRCRVWVDGVPPGHQPPVTSCADAERERVQYGANARVIYGSERAFPGKGKGKHKQRDRDRDRDDDDDRDDDRDDD